MKHFLVSACLLSLVVLTCTGCPSGDKGANGGGKSANILPRIEKLVKANDSMEMATKLPALAVRQAEELKDKPGAMKTMDTAMGACAKIEDIPQRTEAYAKIAEGYGKLSEKSKAKMTLKRALEALGELDEDTSDVDKIKLQIKIAKAQMAMEDPDAAKETLAGAMTAADQLAKLVSKVDVYCEIGECYGVMKSDAGMKAVEAKMNELLETAEDARTKSDTLARLAAVQFKTGMKEAGKATFEEAVKVTDEMKGLGQKAMAYCQLVELALANGMKDVAADLVKKADSEVGLEKDNSLRMQAQEKVAETKKKL